MGKGKNSGNFMPVMFVGHGNPMNAIQGNAFAAGWGAMIDGLPHPRAVLCVSAHWDRRGVAVNTTSRPQTIHDFWGFPRELYDVVYPCPGSPEQARETARIITKAPVKMDKERGLDHGVWAVVKWMYPAADVPVFQLSLDTSRSPAFHYELGRELAPLREKGVLIIGSGNMVHNLSLADMAEDAPPYPWASDFDALLKELIDGGKHRQLVDYGELGPSARLAIPTPEHYLPLLSVLGAGFEDEPVRFYNEAIDLRSVSMTSLRIG